MSLVSFRQVHLDFHTSPFIPDVGKDFDAEEFARTLKKAKVDSVNVFSKCHHGYCYYPTKIGKNSSLFEEGSFRRDGGSSASLWNKVCCLHHSSVG